MLKAFKYRLEPNQKQIALINKHIGSCRFVYNLALEVKQTAYVSVQKNLSCFDLVKQLPALKEQCEWLKEINAQSLQQSIINLDSAFTSFFKGQSKYPKFKKKSSAGSFRIPQGIILIKNKISVPKFREGIILNLHRPLKGEIKQATISRTSTGKYFVSILCETGEQCKPKSEVKPETTVGIDLGIKTFIVASDGSQFDNPKFLRQAESRLKFIQRKYSKHKGKRTKQRLALLHEKVANQRKDYLHKTSSELIKNHDSIAIETLQVQNMLKNHSLAKSISDAGWGEFVRQLEYKAEWYGANILRIGTFEPSSKMCSGCGSINRELTLAIRKWTCSCGAKHDRDINAAINIRNFALRNYVSGTEIKTHGELPTLVGVLTHEAAMP